MKAVILTVSDRSSRGEREDLSGPALRDWLASRQVEVVQLLVVADEVKEISKILSLWADRGSADLIITTGGTGVSPRDVTPEATEAVVERVIPGFGEVMRAKSLGKTPHAMISRALAGIRGESLIVNLPGSPRGALENMEAIWDAIPHAVSKIKGDGGDCGTLK